jgi:hypothetical protein
MHTVFDKLDHFFFTPRELTICSAARAQGGKTPVLNKNRKKLALVFEVLGSTTSAGRHTLYLKVKSFKTKNLTNQSPENKCN